MERKLLFLCAVLALYACPMWAGILGTKSFTPQEISEQWQLFNEQDKTLEWGAVTDDGIVISYKTTSAIVKIKSISELYDVRNVTVDYSVEESSAVFTIDDVDVGDVHLEYGNIEGSPIPSEWNSPSGITAFGNVCVTTDWQKGRTKTVTIKSIKVTYDMEGGVRNLKWSASDVTAYIGEEFTSPTLSGNCTDGVVYTSSNPAVALVDETGKVSVINLGETVIKASAPAQGVWNVDEALYRLTVARSASFISATVNVATPGTLKDLLLDLDSRPEELVITGKLNSADLAYINSGTGKISAVKEVDMSAVSFEYDNGCYATIATRKGADIGLGSTTYVYYLSDEYKIEEKSSPTGLGGASVTVSTYTNSLAGLFGGNEVIRRVVLPCAMDSIGDKIFFSSVVENVTLPEKIKSVPSYAFGKTSKLLSISLPSSVEKIGEYAFAGSSVVNVNAPGVIEVDAHAFDGSSIKTFDLSKIKKLGEYSFSNSKLSGEIDLTLLDVIPKGSFYATPIIGVRFSNCLKRIDDGAFRYTGLKSVTLPEGLVYIGATVFNCESIEEMSIPSSVTFIGQYALDNPWKYKQPTELGVWYFAKIAYEFDSRIDGVEEISIKEGTVSVSPNFASQKLKTTLKKLSFPSTLKMIGSYEIAESYNSSNYGPFAEMEQLVTVNFPEGLEVIGDGCFKNCAKLNVPAFPASLRVIGEEAFMGCVKIAEIAFPEGLEYTGRWSFAECSGLYLVKVYSENLLAFACPFGYHANIESVTIGAKVRNIPPNMFSDCTGLSRVKFENPDGATPELEFGDKAFYGCGELTIDALPARTVKIGEEAFCNVIFKGEFNTANIRSIGTRAFEGSKGITELTLNGNLLECGCGAFSNIASLQTVYYRVPNLKYIEDSYYVSPFSRSSNFRDANLSKVVIGANVEYIPKSLFNYQSTIREVIFESRCDKTRAGVASLLIDERAFYQCSAIREVLLPDCRTAIGARAFRECMGISSLRLGNGTENIDESAFELCSGIESVDVPPTVISLGTKALYAYNNSPSLYFHTQEPPTLGDLAVNKQSVIIVPLASEAAYKATVLSDNPFKTFSMTSFTIDKEKLVLGAGDKSMLTVAVTPSDFSGLDMNWTSSNPEVASVDNNGNVTAINPGEAVITVAPAYVSGFIAECRISVTDGSGVGEIESDGNPIRVVVKEGSIEIFNACTESQVRLYTIDGRLVSCGVSKTIDYLKKGVYIVSCEGQSLKVVVN